VVRHRDEGVGLVVLQPDVVPRLVALYQVGFEEQRLRLGVGDGEVDPGRALDHPPDPLAAGVGVRPDPVADVDGLPDVQHPVVGLELIHPRFRRELGGPLPERCASIPDGRAELVSA